MLAGQKKNFQEVKLDFKNLALTNIESLFSYSYGVGIKLDLNDFLLSAIYNPYVFGRIGSSTLKYEIFNTNFLA
ncbi:MAG: hypothetical protein N3D10_04035 [Candidatus Micrarchaeota archaeon]|nr:hypothetical protein [Candidatus Micrarchaeota archaeon]